MVRKIFLLNRYAILKSRTCLDGREARVVMQQTPGDVDPPGEPKCPLPISHFFPSF